MVYENGIEVEVIPGLAHTQKNELKKVLDRFHIATRAVDSMAPANPLAKLKRELAENP